MAHVKDEKCLTALVRGKVKNRCQHEPKLIERGDFDDFHLLFVYSCEICKREVTLKRIKI